MRYTVSAIPESGKEYTAVVKMRIDADMNTLFAKCINEIAWKLIDAEEIPVASHFQYELPNVWKNGCVGSAWICNPFINITIRQENGAWLAL